MTVTPSPSANARLTSGPVRGHLVRMALPMVLALFAIMAVDLTDTFFVGQLGGDELAALSFAMPVVMVVINLGIGLAAGLSSVLARTLGAGRVGEAQRVTTYGMLLGAGIGGGVAIVGMMTIDPLFALLGAGPEIVDLVRFPMVLNYIAFAFLIPSMMGMSAIRATGDSRRASQVMILAALLNAVLDPILIFGLLGAPRLELTGAALATLIARVIATAYGVYVLRRKAHLLTWDWRGMADILASWKKTLAVGLPAVGTNIIIPLSAGLLVVVIARFGEAAVAGYGVATRIESLGLIAFYAVSSIIGPFVGQNHGAGLPGRIRQAMRLISVFCLLTGLALAGIFWLFGALVAAQFSDSARITEVGALYLAIVPVSFGAAGIVMVVNAAFNGLGQPLPAVAISLVRSFGLMVPLAYAGAWWAGLPGLFAAIAFAHAASAIGAYMYFMGLLERESPKTGPSPHSPPMQ